MIPSVPLEKEIKSFLGQVGKSDLSQAGKKLVKRALFFALDAHHGDTRLSGEEFIFHPIAVAELLLEIKQPAEIIAAALLHDVVEDTKVSLSEIEDNFGGEVFFYVDGMTKIFVPCHIDDIERVFGSSVASVAREIIGAEELSLIDKDIIYQAKLITFARRNYRVVFIRLADRVHNLRTVKSLPVPKRKSVAQETLEFHIPLAWEFIPKRKLKKISSWLRELDSLANQQLDSEVPKSIIQRSARPCLSAS